MNLDQNHKDLLYLFLKIKYLLSATINQEHNKNSRLESSHPKSMVLLESLAGSELCDLQ